VNFEVLGPDAKFFGVRSENKGESELPDKTTSYAVLYPKMQLDYETNREHRIKIKAKSVVEYQSVNKSAGEIEPEIDVLVKVGNVNEPPQFTEEVYIFEGKWNFF